MHMQELVKEIELSLDKVTDWKLAQKFPNGDDTLAKAVAFEGSADGWRFVIVDFDIEPQGFPKGSRGYDGAATHGPRGLVVRLLRPAAERAFKRALETTQRSGS